MSEQETGKRIPGDDPVAVELLLAVRVGDVEAIQRLLRNDPSLVSARLVAKDGGTRTPSHLVTDWPGYFPNGPQIVQLLIDAGADPNARTTGRPGVTDPGETPLHWAASSDDVDVAEALIERGADIEAPDGSIGTPLDNAVGYGCWHVARLLVTHGATVDKAWQASALGMLAASKRSLETTRRRSTCRKRSGMPARAASAARRSICCREARISTGSRTTRTAHRLTPPAGWVPGRRTSSPGCASWEPVPPVDRPPHPSGFNVRQPPARLLAMMCLNMAVRAGALMTSPWRKATVRAVLLSWPAVMIRSGSGTMPPS